MRLVRGLTLLSLALCVATCVLWRRSYARDVTRDFTFRGQQCWICVSQGRVRVSNEPEEAKRKEERDADLVNVVAELNLADGKLEMIRLGLALQDGHRPSPLTRVPSREEFLAMQQEWTARLNAAKARMSSIGSLAKSFSPWRQSCEICFLVAALAILPGLALARYRRRRLRIALGLCADCGYDLRATPGRCPECGSVGGGRAS
jgi:hypothetical protein